MRYCPPIYVLCVSSHLWTVPRQIKFWAILIKSWDWARPLHPLVGTKSQVCPKFFLDSTTKAALGCFLVITMNTVVSDIFIFGLDMVFKLSFVRHCKITFFTVISCVIMPCSSMNLNDGLGCLLIITLWALELYFCVLIVYDIWGFASLLPCNQNVNIWTLHIHVLLLSEF